MPIPIALLTANLGTQHGHQSESLHSLLALDRLLNVDESKSTSRKVLATDLLSRLLNTCVRMTVRPLLKSSNSGLVVFAMQEAPTSEKFNFVSVWKQRNWVCHVVRNAGTVIMAAIDPAQCTQLVPSDFVHKKENAMGPILASRCAALALYDRQDSVATRSSDTSMRCIIVSYHGPRSMKPQARASHLTDLLDWMAKTADCHKVPVWVMGDFNVAFTKCQQIVQSWPCPDSLTVTLPTYLPSRRAVADEDTPHQAVIDFAICMQPSQPTHLTCRQEAHRCFDIADAARNVTQGMAGVLHRNYFDHDAVMWTSSLTIAQ